MPKRRKTSRRGYCKTCLLKFYPTMPGRERDLRCVVSLTPKPAQVHHLDEVRSHSCIENLVPVETNAPIENQRNRVKFTLPELDTSTLDAASRHHFDTGEWAAAYGASRLGAFVALRSDHFNLGLTFCAKSLLALRSLFGNRYAHGRHAFSVATFVSDVLIRSVRPHLHRATFVAAAELALELGSYFRDGGDFEEFEEFALVTAALLRRCEPEDDRARFLRCRLSQHRAIAFTGQMRWDEARREFDRAILLSRPSRGVAPLYPQERSNRLLYEVKRLISQRRFDEAAARIREIERLSDRLAMTAWNGSEVLMSEVLRLVKTGRSREARDQLMKLMRRGAGSRESYLRVTLVLPPTVAELAVLDLPGTHNLLRSPEDLNLIRPVTAKLKEALWKVCSRVRRQD